MSAFRCVSVKFYDYHGRKAAADAPSANGIEAAGSTIQPPLARYTTLELDGGWKRIRTRFVERLCRRGANSNMIS